MSDNEFEKYSMAQDYIVDYDDPFGPDFTVQIVQYGVGWLIDPKNLKHNVIIPIPYNFDKL